MKTYVLAVLLTAVFICATASLPARTRAGSAQITRCENTSCKQCVYCQEYGNSETQAEDNCVHRLHDSCSSMGGTNGVAVITVRRDSFWNDLWIATGQMQCFFDCS